MAYSNFVVKNTLVVNTSFTVNSTSLSYSGNNSFSGITLFTGNTVYSNNVIFNAGANVYANGSLGAAGQALVSNGSSVYWGTVVAGSNTQVQFNNSGQPAGAAGLTFNNTTNSVSISNALSVGGGTTISGNANISGIVNITGGGGFQALSLYSGGDIWLYSAGNTNSAQIYCDNANEIRTNGNSWVAGSLLVVGDVITNYSDDRLKDKVSSIPNALDKIKALDGFYYIPNKTAINLGIEQNQLQKVGVSAQQVQAVLPEVIKNSPYGNGYLTVQYEKLVPLLIEAIKELTAKVEKLGG